MLTEGEAKTTHGGFRFVKGELVQRVEYTPFGKERFVLNSALEELPKYTGQTDDIETDLYYYGSRYYDPVLGRFIQPDSIIPDAYSSQALNSYAYVLGNPLRYVDPAGYAASEVDRNPENDGSLVDDPTDVLIESNSQASGENESGTAVISSESNIGHPILGANDSEQESIFGALLKDYGITLADEALEAGGALSATSTAILTGLDLSATYQDPMLTGTQKVDVGFKQSFLSGGIFLTSIGIGASVGGGLPGAIVGGVFAFFASEGSGRYVEDEKNRYYRENSR